jgi:hypothetical protein
VSCDLNPVGVPDASSRVDEEGWSESPSEDEPRRAGWTGSQIPRGSGEIADGNGDGDSYGGISKCDCAECTGQEAGDIHLADGIGSGVGGGNGGGSDPEYVVILRGHPVCQETVMYTTRDVWEQVTRAAPDGRGLAMNFGRREGSARLAQVFLERYRQGPCENWFVARSRMVIVRESSR